MSAAAAPGLPALEKYELLEEIGHGGMATVYRARDLRLGREVAVKIIHRHLRENAEVGARFIAEARAAAKLRHPNIVEVYDVDVDAGGERYLVVELVRGSTLRKVLKEHRDMPPEIGAMIVLELCEAIEHAHAASIIHRDIKPENVLIELPEDRARACEPKADEAKATETARRRALPEVIIKITDFGIAKLLDAQGVTSTGQVLGSPAHMAPEQIEGGQVDARTDVFGLGVLMYECLVGHLPFEGQNPAQVLRKVLEGLYAPADRERPVVGGRWARIIAQALAREPEQRTASPSALGQQIAAELEELGMGEPRAEIAAYFADPEGYAAALTERLVSCLIARGERARAAGDVTGAAADFNRALALSPSDPAIMKRITALTSSAGRRLLLRRAALIVGGSAALGVLAFGVARMLKPRPVEAMPEANPLSSAAPPMVAEVEPRAKGPDKPAPSGEPVADSSAAPPAASASAHSHRLKFLFPPASVAPSASAPVSQTPRKVMFVINPMNGKLVVDGQPVSNWFTSVLKLKPGPHDVMVSVEGSKCCKPFRGSRMVEPAPEGDPERLQKILIALELLPATVTLGNAPSGGQFSCPTINLSGAAGSPRTVTLSEAIWNGRCLFISPDQPPRESSVSLRAGEANVLSWPVR